jgi:hypothetical protein
MKLNVKTLKGTSFEIEAAAEASVRHLPFPYPTLLPLVSLQSERLRAIIGRFAGDGCDFAVIGRVGFGDCSVGRGLI